MRAQTYDPQPSRHHRLALTLAQSSPRSVWVETANRIKYHPCDEMLHGNKQKILGGLTHSGKPHTEISAFSLAGGRGGGGVSVLDDGGSL